MYIACSVKNKVKKIFFASENKMADEKQQGSRQYLPVAFYQSALFLTYFRVFRFFGQGSLTSFSSIFIKIDHFWQM